MKVKVYAGGTLGGEQQVASAMQGGTVEASMMAPAQLVGMIKEFVVLDFPFAFANEREADYVLDGPVGRKLMDKLPEKGLVGLGYMEQGYRSITNSKRPINKLEDIQGLKIRTILNPLYIDMLNALGANAVPMPFPELYTALESEGGRRPGEPVRDRRGVEVLRGAEVLQQHPAHLQPADDAGEQEVLGPAVGRREEDPRRRGRRGARLPAQGGARDERQVAPVPCQARACRSTTSLRRSSRACATRSSRSIDKYSAQVGEPLVKEFYAELEKARAQK